MKANVRYGALALLWIAACNRPDEALFDGVPSDDDGVAGSATAGTAATTAGSSNNAGGTGATTSVGGSTTTPGGAADMDAAGSPGTPDGAAGMPDNVAGSSNNTAGTGGTGGSGEPPKPPEPVCGNGKLEAGEECDDSGHAGKDGCDACKVVCSDFGNGTLESEDHHCYNGYDAATFEGSIAACKEKGGHLATISSEAENKIAQKFVNNSKWLGGREDVAVNMPGSGNYTWITGEALTYENWHGMEPDQGKYRCEGGGIGPAAGSCYQHCISMAGDGTWSDERCDVSDGYVCEWEPAGTK